MNIGKNEVLDCLVIGGGVVGSAIAFTLAHRGVSVGLVEKESEFGLAASGTNSGCLHTGFDSIPGELETDMILRSVGKRERVLDALSVPVLKCGATLSSPHEAGRETIEMLKVNAERNGVHVVHRDDGVLEIPGEWITNPVEYTTALARSAEKAGARIVLGSKVVGVTEAKEGFAIALKDGRTIHSLYVINAAGLFADEIAGFIGDPEFSIYPRKGEFLVFDLPEGETLDGIILPIPTEKTKGILVFPTVDGKVIAGPTAIDLEDKNDWTVREEAAGEILAKVTAEIPELANLKPIASYCGLRPAGVNSNYVIGPHKENPAWINVAAIRSTGLSASLGIGEYVTELLGHSGLELGEELPIQIPDAQANTGNPSWWARTADHFDTTVASA